MRLTNIEGKHNIMEFNIVSVMMKNKDGGMEEKAYIDNERYIGTKEETFTYKGIDRKNMISVFNTGYKEYVDFMSEGVAKAIGVNSLEDYINMVGYVNNDKGVIVAENTLSDRITLKEFRRCILNTMNICMRAREQGVSLSFITESRINAVMEKLRGKYRGSLETSYYKHMTVYKNVRKVLSNKG